MNKEKFTNKVYDLLICLFAQQENVKIEYCLKEKQEKRAKEPA